MVAQLVPAPHPILSALTTSQEALEAVRDVQPVYMSPAEKKTAITEVARLEAMTAELKLRVVATADDAAALALSRDTGAWLASVTRADFGVGRADARLAEALDRRWTGVAAGMADGKVSRRRRGPWSRPWKRCPTTSTDVGRGAEAQMVEYCHSSGPASCAAWAATSWKWSRRRSPRPTWPNDSRTRNNSAREKTTPAVQADRGRDGPDHDHPPRGVPGPVVDLPRSVHQSSQAPGCGAG